MKKGIFRPKLLHRKRIFNIMSQILETPLFFVSASMGYGKTLAVKEFLDSDKDLWVTWLSLADEEKDADIIWKKVTESMFYFDENLSKMSSSFGCPRTKADILKVIELIRDNIDSDTVFVVDDWQNINIGTNLFTRFVKELCLAEIPNLHIVIISRKNLPDEFVEMEYKQKCIVVRQEDLEFTVNETTEFFKINGFLLNEEERKQIYSYTGGWTSATYLALLQYYNQQEVKDTFRAEEMLKIMIFNNLEEESQKVLLSLAPLNNFTIRQACEISGTKKAADIIQAMKKDNCFIKYDSNTHSFAFHSILKKVLQRELLNSSVDSNQINDRCAQWYAENGNSVTAIEYYYESKNYEKILQIIDNTDYFNLVQIAPKTVFKVFDFIDEQQKLNHPIAYITYIFCTITQSGIKGKIQLLNKIERYYEKQAEITGDYSIVADIYFVRSGIAAREEKDNLNDLKKAYELFDGRKSKIFTPNMAITFGSVNLISLCFFQKGKLIDAIDNGSKKIKYISEMADGFSEGAQFLYYAEYYYYIGNLTEALAYSKRAKQRALTKKQECIVVSALFNIIKIEILTGKQRAFEKNIKELKILYNNIKSKVIFSQIESTLVFLYGILEIRDKLPEWIIEQDASAATILFPAASSKYITIAVGLVLRKKYIELEVYVEDMIKAINPNQIINLVYTYIFDIIAKYNLYGLEKAKNSINKAIEFTKQDHIITPWIELAVYVNKILKELNSNDLFVKEIIFKQDKYIKNFKSYNLDDNSNIEITDRELQVMKLIEAGYTQKQIAQELHIAVVTVKKHLQSVYFKLDVKNKVLAINKLRKIGII